MWITKPVTSSKGCGNSQQYIVWVRIINSAFRWYINPNLTHVTVVFQGHIHVAILNK